MALTDSPYIGLGACYDTPINKLGYMMFPTQREAENTIKKLEKVAREVLRRID